MGASGGPAGTVAMLFTDIEGSTRLARLLGEQWPAVLRQHHEIVGGAITAAGGFVSGTDGDAFFATFTDTAAAVTAATAAQRALRGHPWPATAADIRVRMGIHTGEVAVVDDEYVGLEIHRAARVGAASHGAQVLLTAAARRLLTTGIEVEDLGLHRLKDFPEPERLFHLSIDPDRPASWFPPPRSLDARPTNLPPNDRTLFGRDSDLAAVTAAVAGGQRLVTLTGPGGVGKTSAALAAARLLLADQLGGVWLVPAEALRSADELPAAIAAAVNVPTFDAVVERFDGIPVLWVLDNLEHLRGAGTVVSSLLTQVPTLRVLATSRTPLRLRGERVVPLAPLAGDDAAAVLADRVGQAGGVLDLDDPAAIELGRRLHGLPLALELVAARLRFLTPSEVLERLGSTLDLKGAEADRPERHRSLRATLEWSLGLLTPRARWLFTRMAVFAGPVPLDVIEEVCAGDGIDVVEGVFELIDHSLLGRTADGLGLVAALHEIAAELFEAAADADAVRRAHAEAMVALTERNRSAEGGGEAVAQALDADIWAATVWARSADPSLHRRLVGASASTHWQFTGRLGQALLEVAIALEGMDEPSESRGLLLLEQAQLRMMSGDAVGAATSADAALPLVAHRQGLDRSIDLGSASFAYLAAGQLEKALSAIEASVAAARSAGATRQVVAGLANLAQALLGDGRMEEAGAALDEAEELAATDAPQFDPVVGGYRGDWHRASGAPELALERYALTFGVERSYYEPWWFAGVALALGDLGEVDAALEAAGAARASAEERGIHVDALTQFGESLPSAMARWRQQAGPVQAAAAEGAGRALTSDERRERAIALAQAGSGTGTRSTI